MSVSAAAIMPPVHDSAVASMISCACAGSEHAARQMARIRRSFRHPSRIDDRGRGDRRDAFAAADEAQLLVRRRLDRDPVERQCRAWRQVPPSSPRGAGRSSAPRRSARRRHWRCARRARAPDGCRMFDEEARSRALPLRVRRREMQCRCRRRRRSPAARRSARADRHRRRNGPTAPRSCGIATPHSVTWSPGAKAMHVIAVAGAHVREGRGGDARQQSVGVGDVGRPGELDVLGRAGDEPHRQAGPFGDRRVVGEVGAALFPGPLVRRQDRVGRESPAASARQTGPARGTVSPTRPPPSARFSVSETASAGSAPWRASVAAHHAVDERRRRRRGARRHGSAPWPAACGPAP